jgi:hypothetical protein
LEVREAFREAEQAFAKGIDLGELGTEAPAFAPTRYELVQIFKHHIMTILDLDYEFWANEGSFSGSSGWRISQFASRRVRKIVDILGLEVVKPIYNEAAAEYAKHYSPATWQSFLDSGKAFHSKVIRELRA